MENIATKPEANINGIAEQKDYKLYYQCAKIPKPCPDTVDKVYDRIIFKPITADDFLG